MPTLERTDALPALKGVPLFAGLTPQQLRRVAEVGRVRLFRAGTAIVHLAEPGDTFYVILDGNALVVRETGRPLKLHAGDFFGELFEGTAFVRRRGVALSHGLPSCGCRRV